MKNGKQLAMVSFVNELLRKDVMIQFVWDNNLTQQVEMENQHISKKSYKECVENTRKELNKEYPDCIIEHKEGSVLSFMNYPVYNRMISNIQHMNLYSN